MTPKAAMMIVATITGLVASYIPVLFGASAFGELSLFTGSLGTVFGVWLTVKLYGY